MLVLLASPLAFADRYRRADPGFRRPLVVRWFLRDGWGSSKQAYSEEVVMSDLEAGFLLPCFTPRDTRVLLTMEAPEDLQILVNNVPVGQVKRRPARNRFAVVVPSEVLFRGDNLVTLVRKGEGLYAPRLRRISLQPLSKR